MDKLMTNINLRDIFGMRKAKLRANGEDWGDCALEYWDSCDGWGGGGMSLCRYM
jgi:hypothetical protein